MVCSFMRSAVERLFSSFSKPSQTTKYRYGQAEHASVAIPFELQVLSSTIKWNVFGPLNEALVHCDHVTICPVSWESSLRRPPETYDASIRTERLEVERHR